MLSISLYRNVKNLAMVKILVKKTQSKSTLNCMDDEALCTAPLIDGGNETNILHLDSHSLKVYYAKSICQSVGR